MNKIFLVISESNMSKYQKHSLKLVTFNLHNTLQHVQLYHVHHEHVTELWDCFSPIAILKVYAWSKISPILTAIERSKQDLIIQMFF